MFGLGDDSAVRPTPALEGGPIRDVLPGPLVTGGGPFLGPQQGTTFSSEGVATQAVPGAAPVGSTFWDFLQTSTQYDVQTFAQKYQVLLIVGGLAVVGAFMFFGKRK